MIPLSGFSIYQEIRQANCWVQQFLPNADGPPQGPQREPNGKTRKYSLQTGLETILRSPLGKSLENWEMNRKIHKFTSQFANTAETRFSPERCQGHFDGYGKRTMESFQTRLKMVQVEPVPAVSGENLERVGTSLDK